MLSYFGLCRNIIVCNLNIVWFIVKQSIKVGHLDKGQKMIDKSHLI